MRCYWDEEDVWFYFEVDAEGWVTRQVELQGPGLTPIAAASLEEWQRAHDAGRLDEYDDRFGITHSRAARLRMGRPPPRATYLRGVRGGLGSGPSAHRIPSR